MTLALLTGLLLSIIPDNVEALSQKEIDEKFPLIKTIENVPPSSTNTVLSGSVADQSGDDLIVGYLEEDNTGNTSVKLVSSNDGGETWDEPKTIYPFVDCYFMRIDLIIHDGLLFFFYEIAWTSEWETWELYSTEVPIGDLNNVTDHPHHRLDDEISGFMSFSQAVIFENEVRVFWVRSHYIDCMYRIYRDGEWTSTSQVDSGGLISNFAVISSDISGTNTLHLFYVHHPSYRVYQTTSTDGVTWSPAQELLYMTEKPNKLAVVEKNDRLQLVVDERNGYDIYHSFSSDGSKWEDFRIVGEHTENLDTTGINYAANVALASSDHEISIYLAYEYDDGVVLKESRDNGSTFEEICTFKDPGAYYPVFDHQAGLIIFSVDRTNLEVRRLDGRMDGVTDPQDPDNNRTDPQEPIPPSGPIVNVTQSLLEGGELVLSASVGDTGDYSVDELTYEWIIEGEGIIGTGKEIEFNMPPGQYIVVLRIYYDEDHYLEDVRSVTVGGEKPGNNDPFSLFYFVLPVLAVLFTITVLSIIVIRKRKDRSSPTEGDQERGSSTRKRVPSVAPKPPVPAGIQSGSLMDGASSPSFEGSYTFVSGSGTRTSPLEIPIPSGSFTDISTRDLRDAVMNMEVQTDINTLKEQLRKKARSKRSKSALSKNGHEAVENILDNIDG